MEAIALDASHGVGKDVDVLVRLLSPNSMICYAEIPHHSHILRTRSDFFAARLSERWTPTSSTAGSITTIDITMRDKDAAAVYKRCLQLMDVPRTRLYAHRPFSGVSDALRMLEMAAHMLFHDCMDACMEYLEMLPSWTHEEEESIRSSLSSLQLPRIHPDLSLPNHGIPSDEPLLIMRRMLLHVLSMACKSHKLPELHRIDISKPIPDSTILRVWDLNINVVKARLQDIAQPYLYSYVRVVTSHEAAKSAVSILSWLLRKLLELQVADIVVNAFAKDAELSSLLRDAIELSESLALDLLCLSNSIMHAVQNGDVLLPRVSRLTFITTWLPTMLMCSSLTPSNADPTFTALINSLPVSQREQFFKDITRPDYQGFLQLDSSFAPWCDSLRKAHLLLAPKEEISLVTNDDS